MPSVVADFLPKLKEVVSRYWGFQSLRPLQESAMLAVLQGRDSLVVLPTGGGKSLCYQAPAVLRGDTTVVVSPLISLMKDQVDGLKANGVAAAAINSGQTESERGTAERELLQGKVRLLFVSPERLVISSFQQLLRRVHVHTFAIDEAHCISHWGHDFRPPYRQLNQLKKVFPEASVHAYTATATEKVRRDIIEQLGLKKPEVLVGSFDRPNLTYRVVARLDLDPQVREVIDRHAAEAGIIYCIRRRDVDELAASLRAQGLRAMPYHAGLSADLRKQTQDAFAEEKCDLVVATVAFGMGIDRSNIRFVLHTGMPKSIEHYQQETGRAGRDGLEAECVLLYSGGDLPVWKRIIAKGATEKAPGEPEVDPAFLASAHRHLEDMDRYCRGAVCRHRALVQYFGQRYDTKSCQACDLCLGDAEPVPEALVLAQKILSCVARVKERFGIGHVASVLRGEDTEKIRQRGHDQLSTFGLLQDHDKAEVRDWIHQLLSQELLVQDGEEYPVLKLTPASWEVMRGQRGVRLLQRAKRKLKRSKADTLSWEGVDQELFEAMRKLRQRLASEQAVPPYVIFSDATLRELARTRPSTLERMRLVYGIGTTKLEEFGDAFLKLILQHCREQGLPMDVADREPKRPPSPSSSSRPNRERELAVRLFGKGIGIEEVMRQTGRGRSTVVEYLSTFIRDNRPASLAPWINPEIEARVRAAAREVGAARLKPIFIALNEQIPYDDIRIVVAALDR